MFTRKTTVIFSTLLLCYFASADWLDKETRFAEHLRHRQPCSSDCDIRIFPHCTQECKCDYDFPRVQRFCNPPPLPMFLNTCRLWYNGCPKFEQYHYSSQFVYSKAEKGKVLPGGVKRPIVDPDWAERTGFVIPPDIPH